MTEAEWLASPDLDALLDFLSYPVQVSYRKLRLYACACCRGIPDFMTSLDDVESMEHAEREADGLLPPDTEYPKEDPWDIRWYRCDEWNSAARAVASYRDHLWDTHQLHEKSDDERARIIACGHRHLTDLLRDVVGNPFRPAAFDPAWRTSTVMSLASQMYESRDFGAMPILADALQDAGCDNEDILNHCRGDGPHVRGCWVVDLVLGKV